jgi:hypothetical protein
MVAEQTRRRSFRNGGARSQPAEWVEEYPFTSVTVMFGIGVGVGLILGHTIAEAAGRRMFHQDTLAEKVTCQIRDVLKNALPQSLSRHMS